MYALYVDFSTWEKFHPSWRSPHLEMTRLYLLHCIESYAMYTPFLNGISLILLYYKRLKCCPRCRRCRRCVCTVNSTYVAISAIQPLRPSFPPFPPFRNSHHSHHSAIPPFHPPSICHSAIPTIPPFRHSAILTIPTIPTVHFPIPPSPTKSFEQSLSSSVSSVCVYRK